MTEPSAPQGTTTLESNAPRVGRRQLAIIGGVLAVAAVAGLALGAMLSGGRGASLGPSAGYVPADAVMYLEARLDLPGAQRANLRAILERFPGVNADDVLTDALADTLDEALASSDAPFDYSGDIAPWFTGQVAMALLDYPVATAPAAQMEVPSALAAFGVRDAAAATAFGDTVRAELESSGATFTSSDHAGVTVWTLEMADAQAFGLSGSTFAYAVTDDQLLLATGDGSIERALDVHAGDADSLAGRSDVRDLAAKLPSEVSGLAIFDTRAALDEVMAEVESTAPEVADALRPYVEDAPPIVVSSLSFESDAVRFDGVSDAPGGALEPSNARRELAKRIPGDAIFFADAGNVGTTLEQLIATLKATVAASPTGEADMAQLDQVEAALGATLEDFVAWMDDAAMAAGWDGTQAWGGALIQTDDPDTARQRLDQLRALVRLAAASGSSDVTVTTEDVDGVEVTTIRAGTGGVEVGATPVSEIVVEYAIDGDTALIGIGDRFVRRVLSLDEGGALAASDRFTTAVDRFGGLDNTGTFFVDLVALREAAIQASGVALPDDAAANLEPLDYIVGVSRVEGGDVVSRMGLVLR